MIASKWGRSDPPGRQTYCALQGHTRRTQPQPRQFYASGKTYRSAGTKLAIGVPLRERSLGSLVSPCTYCDAWLGTDEPALPGVVSALLTGSDRVEALPLHPAEALVLGDGGDLDSTTNRLRQEDGEADKPDSGLDQETCEVDRVLDRHRRNGERNVEIADQLLLELAGFRRWHPVLDQRANVKAKAEDEAIERLVLPILHHSEVGLLHDAARWWAMLPGHVHLPNQGEGG